jgi:tetratricopeptide (TPR) repeat protein
MHRKFLLVGACALLAILIAVWALHRTRHAPPSALAQSPPPPAPPVYVGAEACKGCHTSQYQAWMGSHHQLAMQEATAATVLGDFHDAKFVHGKVTSRFYRKDEKFFVSTDGADGRQQDFEIRYTFGVYPLQQYLVPFPDGRLQALSIAWDARPRAQGGQRWIHLYPHENIGAGDELHWTQLQQNWNYMCAECHSTDLRKNYDAATNTYRTSWKDISVACESCHGAGSAHLQWAAAQAGAKGAGAVHEDGLLAHFDDRQGASWILDTATGNSHRSQPRANTQEVETCGRCHARAAKISEDWSPTQPLTDTHRVTLLEEGMYTADGQMQDEVYNYGSFVQSRMFAAGVTCSDCHDPHSQKLRVTDQEVCGRCHTLAKYAAASHHHHKEQGPESRCAACHMPVRTYMVVDQRHDHSFRIPRPDESVKYGTPNACSDCHKDKPATWAAKAAAGWYGSGDPGYQHFTAALFAARHQTQTVARELLSLAADGTSPDIARATALSELGGYMDSNGLAAAQAGLRSPDNLVRLAAVELFLETDAATRWEALGPLLRDPVRAVRIAAASEVADALPAGASAAARQDLEAALSDYVATRKLNADRPEAHLALGDLYTRQRNAEAAESEYRQAIKLWAGFVPAYVNLADLSRSRQHDEEAEHWLTQAAQVAPDNAAVALSLGLLRVRQHKTAEALQQLARATKLAPENAHYAYVYAVGLYSSGTAAAGLDLLRRTHERFPGNREVLYGLASLAAESGDLEAAKRYAQSFVAMAPADPRGAELLGQLKQRSP